MGIPLPDNTNVFMFEGVNITTDKVPEEYLNNTWKLMSDIKEESSKYEDILIGAFQDTYYNLTMKLIFTYRWISTACQEQTELVLFLDDDISVVPKNIIRFVQNIPRSYQQYFVGGRETGSDIIRPKDSQPPSPWSVSENEIPWNQYPPYLSGLGYFLGSTVVLETAIISAFTKDFRIDDVYLGIMLVKLKYPMLKIDQIYASVRKENIDRYALLIPSYANDAVNWTTEKLHTNHT